MTLLNKIEEDRWKQRQQRREDRQERKEQRRAGKTVTLHDSAIVDSIDSAIGNNPVISPYTNTFQTIGANNFEIKMPTNFTNQVENLSPITYPTTNPMYDGSSVGVSAEMNGFDVQQEEDFDDQPIVNVVDQVENRSPFSYPLTNPMYNSGSVSPWLNSVYKQSNEVSNNQSTENFVNQDFNNTFANSVTAGGGVVGNNIAETVVDEGQATNMWQFNSGFITPTNEKKYTMLDSLMNAVPETYSINVMPEFDKQKAVEFLKKNAQPYYIEEKCKKCATAVRLALEQGGISTLGHPTPAKDYFLFLPKIGFTEISKMNYIPECGDVIVHEAQVDLANKIDHPNGHIAMYDGKIWISDFIQSDMFGGGAYRTNPNYTLWRYK